MYRAADILLNSQLQKQAADPTATQDESWMQKAQRMAAQAGEAAALAGDPAAYEKRQRAEVEKQVLPQYNSSLAGKWGEQMKALPEDAWSEYRKSSAYIPFDKALDPTAKAGAADWWKNRMTEHGKTQLWNKYKTPLMIGGGLLVGGLGLAALSRRKKKQPTDAPTQPQQYENPRLRNQAVVQQNYSGT